VVPSLTRSTALGRAAVDTLADPVDVVGSDAGLLAIVDDVESVVSDAQAARNAAAPPAPAATRSSRRWSGFFVIMMIK
jgi:hypothetical protein